MTYSRRPARINLRALIILVVVIVVLVVGAIAGHGIRGKLIASNALEAATAAKAQQDWPETCKQLKLYLSKKPDDLDRLLDFAEASLAVEPREPERVAAALGAYRKLFRKQPDNVNVFRKLTRLYMTVGDADETAYLCKQYLNAHPDDLFAMLWLARAQVVARKMDEARQTLEKIVISHPREVQLYSMLAALELETESPDAGSRAMEWVERSVQKNPDSADALAQRARIRRITDAKNPQTVSAAQADLRSAETASVHDPAIRLLIADEWMAWGVFDRARATLEALPQMTAEQFADSDIEFATFTLMRYSAEANLALLSSQTSACEDIARRALGELTDHRRALFLPLAIKLYLAAEKTSEARTALAEYEELSQKQHLNNGERRTILKAMIAGAENDPYTVIANIESLGTAGANDPTAWNLLADAFLRTEQDHRAELALRTYIERIPNDQEALLKLARLNRGRDWERVRSYARSAADIRSTVAARLLEVEAAYYLAADQPDPEQRREQCIKFLTELREAAPDSANTRLLLASMLTAQSRFDEAELELRAVISNPSESLNASLQLAELLDRTGRENDAIDLCQDTIGMHADVASPHLLLARLHVSQGRIIDAQQVLEKASVMLHGPEGVLVEHELARLLIEQGDPQSAATRLDRLAKADPRDLSSRLFLTSLPPVRADRARLDQLITEIKSIEGEHGVRWKLQRALFLLDDADWRTSESKINQLLSDCLKADPSAETPALAMASIDERNDRWTDAENRYREALLRNPQSTEAAQRLAGLFEKRGRYADAEKVLAPFNGQSQQVRKRSLSLAIAQKDYDRAITELEEYIRLGIANLADRAYYAELIYKHRKDSETAQKILDEIATSNPNAPEVLRLQATLLHDAGNTNEALALLERAVEQQPAFDTLRLRAEFLHTIGRNDEAERDFKSLIALNQTPEIAYQLLALFYESVGKSVEALAAWDAGTKTAPSDESLQKGLVRALLASNATEDRVRGQKLLAELRTKNPSDAVLAQLAASASLREGTPESLDEARRSLDLAVEANPSDIQSQLRRIAIMREQGEAESARLAVANAVTQNPSSRDLKLAQIDLELTAGQTAIARGLAQSLADENQHDVTLLVQLSALFQSSEVADIARSFNNRAMQVAPTDIAANLQRADLLWIDGGKKGAIDHLTAFTKTDLGKQNLGIWLRLANFQTQNGESVAADQSLIQAASLADNKTAVTLERMNWLAAQKRYTEIPALVMTCQSEQSDYLAAVSTAARLLLSAGREPEWRQAGAYYQELIVLAPQQIAGYLGAAKASHLLGDTEAAIKAYRDALDRVSPYHAQSLNDLAWLLAHQGKPDALNEAADLATRGLSRYPRNIHLLDTRGVVRMKQGKWREAREDFDRCIALADANPRTQANALLNMAKTMKELREPAGQIREKLERAKTLDQANGALTDEERAELGLLLKGL